MPILLKTNTGWKNLPSMLIKTSSGWKNIFSGYLKTNTGWKVFFQSTLTPSIEQDVIIGSTGGTNPQSTIMSDGSPVTLVGTKYHWNNADVFTYIWQKSSDNINWSNIGTAQSTSNPASGSSSTITKQLSSSDFTSGSDMYFRFVFSATNSTYNTTSTSTSSALLISYYGTPTPQPGSPSISGSTTVGSTNAYGNIGSWTNSPTSYFYQFRFTSGLTSYPLTDIQTRSVSAKTLSGYSATLTTSSNHGYRIGDTFTISGMDTLFNGSYSITGVGSSTISFTINAPTAWANAGTGYSSGTYVSSGGSAYISNQTISSVSQFNGGTLYSAGAIVYFGNNRYQSKLNNNIGNSVTNTTWWDDLGSFAPGGSKWTIQNFSNEPASGTTTGYIYFDGTVYSSTSIPVPINITDAKTLIDLRGKVLTFGVKAYNQATLSPSEYSGTAFIYGYPVITVGTITPSDTSATIAYSQSYMTSYDIDIRYLGSSISGYPKTVTSPSSPISVTGLTGGRTYSYTISPKNGEGTFGTSATGSFTTTITPGTPTISFSAVTSSSFNVSWSATNATSYRVDIYNSISGASLSGYPTTTTSTSASVSGLSPNTSYSVSVYGINNGTNGPTTTSSQTTSLGPALTPTFGANSSFTGGFFGSVTNYDGNYTWGISTSAGSVAWSTPSGSTRAFTVTGLSSGQSATVTVTTSRTGYNNGSAQTTGSASIIQYTVTWNANGGSGGGTTTQNAGVAHTAPSPGTRSGYTFNGYYNTPSGDYTYGPIASGGSFTPPSSMTMYARWTALIPNISSITVTGNVTAGVTCSAVMVNTLSVEYVIYGRDTTTSAWIQLASGTASANGTSLTTSIATTSSVGTLPDQYYVTMTPYSGTRSTSGTGGGTGTAGTQRSTIGSPKSNASGSITVNY